MLLLSILFFFSILIIFYLILTIFRSKKEIQKLNMILSKPDFQRIDKKTYISPTNKELLKLIDTLNKNIDEQKQLHNNITQRELFLKNSIIYISRDLRTPLTDILKNIELIKKDGLNEKQLNYYKLIEEKSVYFKNLIQGFFELSSLESQTSLPAIEKINLEGFVLNWLIENTEMFKKNNVIPKFEFLTENSYIFADNFMLKRVFKNIFINAISHGLENIYISVSKCFNNQVSLIIGNDIINNKEINVDKIFKKYYINNKLPNKNGSGLGLPIVKFIMEKMGGKVDVKIYDKHFEVILTFSNLPCKYFEK